MARISPRPSSILPFLIASALVWPSSAPAADSRLTIKETPLATIPADASPSSLRVSPDGTHFAYEVTRVDGVRAVIDGKESAPYPYVTTVASEDGSRFGYIGRAVNGKGVIVREGAAPLGPFDYPSNLVFSRDGSRWAAWWHNARKFSIVVDGRELTDTGAQAVFFSPDSRRVFCIARQGDLKQVVVDGKAQKAYGGLTEIAFSPDGRHYAYGALAAPGQWVIAIDGAEVARLNVAELASPAVSDDARHTAFTARLSDDRRCAVIDGTLQKPYRRLISSAPPILSPDGRSFAYPAMLPDKTAVMVRDGLESKPCGYASLPAFSPDGKHFAWIRTTTAARKTTARLVMDDAESGGGFVAVSSISYSPDSAHIALIARDDRGWIPVLDGAEANPCERILPVIHFEGNQAFHCFGIREGKLIRIDVAIESGGKQ